MKKLTVLLSCILLLSGCVTIDNQSKMNAYFANLILNGNKKSSTLMQFQQESGDFTNDVPSLNYLSDGGELSVIFKATEAWTAKEVTPTTKGEESWISLSKNSGKAGTNKIIITAAKNKNYDDRSTVVDIKSGDYTYHVKIHQGQLNAIIASETEINISKESQQVEIHAQANVAIDVVIPANASWVKYVSTKALSNSTITLDVEKNTTFTTRKAIVTLRNAETGAKQDVTINQNPDSPYLNIDEDSFDIPESGRMIEINVVSNIDYNYFVENGDSWVELISCNDVASNTKNYKFNIQGNPDQAPRTTHITFLSANSNYPLVESATVSQVALPDYFTITAVEDGLTLKILSDANAPAISLVYSTDTAKTWKDYVCDVANPTEINLNANEFVLFKAGTVLDPSITNDALSSGVSNNTLYPNTFSADKIFDVSGNIMYLLNGITPATVLGSSRNFACLFKNAPVRNANNLSLPATTLTDNCYSDMFCNCSNLLTTPELPAEVLSYRCYYHMFSHCTNLKTVPNLPAKTLSGRCYEGMFMGCISLETVPDDYLPAETLALQCYMCMFMNTSLTKAPKLPATKTEDSCYEYMFSNTPLAVAPELPATTLIKSCYEGMFSDCTALTTAPELPATTLASLCYRYMFSGCSALTTAPVLPATTLTQYCYQEMFKGCIALTSVTILAKNLDANGALNDWLKNAGTTSSILFVDPSIVIDNKDVKNENFNVVPYYSESPATAAVKVGDIWWAPVNCGYDEDNPNGLLYQWGRKYGQSINAGTITPVALTKEEGESNDNKEKFGVDNQAETNWFEGEIDNTLWKNGQKGTYDPCPEGWRVPKQYELRALIYMNESLTVNTGWDDTKKGYWFNGTETPAVNDGLFLPAAGTRQRSGCSSSDTPGGVKYEGTRGYYWSTSPGSYEDDYAQRLSFNNTKSKKVNVEESRRSYGYSVRCVLDKPTIE